MNHTVAKLIRVERDSKSNKVHLIFEIIDEKFKQKIINDWTADQELKLNGKDLEER